MILSLGTDATDLVITNGYRVWQRSIPLGGNHFTKALTKELKLTFAKAEHLKRNATAAAGSQGRVPGDAAGVQRSADRDAALDRLLHQHRPAGEDRQIVALGNAMKLPGLRRYLSQSLGFEVVRLESFARL